MKSRKTNLFLDEIKAQIIKHYQHISERESYITEDRELEAEVRQLQQRRQFFP